jgi:hypothetical protein
VHGPATTWPNSCAYIFADTLVFHITLLMIDSFSDMPGHSMLYFGQLETPVPCTSSAVAFHIDRMSNFMCVFCNVYILNSNQRMVWQAVPSRTLNWWLAVSTLFFLRQATVPKVDFDRSKTNSRSKRGDMMLEQCINKRAENMG